MVVLVVVVRGRGGSLGPPAVDVTIVDFVVGRRAGGMTERATGTATGRATETAKGVGSG